MASIKTVADSDEATKGAGDRVMCECHDRDIDHAFDDDIDQYVVPWRQSSPPAPTAATETGARCDAAWCCWMVPADQAEQELRAYLAAYEPTEGEKA